MKRKKGIKEYLLAGIVVLSCLLCVGCGADEKTLFIEAETTTVDSGMEEMDIESGEEILLLWEKKFSE